MVAELQQRGSDAIRRGRVRIGINPRYSYGVSIPELRFLARPRLGDHALALALWDTGIHEARIMATLIDRPDDVIPAQMDAWIAVCDSWNLVDHCCSILFDRTPYARQKAAEWSGRDEEFVKRGGFSLLVALAAHDSGLPDDVFLGFLAIIEREARDERSFVKKAVAWALKQIGKRNAALNAAAIGSALRIRKNGGRAGRWIASSALRDLLDERLQTRLRWLRAGASSGPAPSA
ncbi:MAG: DNA alkylation repair protein [Dehalococcoidia bacterium]|nr:DNA alkylation repair protein [Dehalococcoidia bacterium]